MYDYNYDSYYESAEFAMTFMIIYLIVMFVLIAVALAAYVMQSVSMYSIANRRGIKHAWLAWLPVGNMWILGCISDQYRYVSRGQVKSKRKVLLTLSIVVCAAVIVLLVLFFGMMFEALEMPMDESALSDEQAMGFVGYVLGFMGVYFAMFGVVIAQAVFMYMALYDLYKSCDPRNCVLYLVLSIVFSITQPIFLLVCRTKDRGMPPRRPPQPVWQPPVWQTPAEPWNQPQPVQEPWDKREP